MRELRHQSSTWSVQYSPDRNRIDPLVPADGITAPTISSIRSMAVAGILPRYITHFENR